MKMILDVFCALVCLAVFGLVLAGLYAAVREYWREILLRVAATVAIVLLFAALLQGGSVIQAFIEGRYP